VPKLFIRAASKNKRSFGTPGGAGGQGKKGSLLQPIYISQLDMLAFNGFTHLVSPFLLFLQFRQKKIIFGGF
jgi:hypothetical protein